MVTPHAPGSKLGERMDGLTIHRFRYFPERLEHLAHEGGILEKIKRRPWVLLQVPFFLAAQVLLIRRLTADRSFQGVHAHWILPQGLCAVLAQMGRRDGVPILCTSHGGDLFGLRGHLFDALRRWVLRRSAALTVVSRAMAEKLRAAGIQTPCHVIPMGTDLSTLFTPDARAPRRKATILFVGRLVEKKGVRYLIEAFGHVRRRIADAELWIVGSGPEEPLLKKLAASIAPVRSLGSELEASAPSDLPPHPGAITFFGPVAHEDLPHFYRAATVTVVPSVVARSGDQEGLGLVMVEAMGCGCPVIASDLPAIRDVIRHGETGLLAPPEQSTSLADAICRALTDPGLLKNLSDHGREWARRHFDWNEIGEKYKRLLNRLQGSPEITRCGRSRASRQ
ncbi:Glycosyltransferase involved in cell wall bisynthesis [Desulfacinum infernum DSM 9756]|uniref:Glycosyltransferase involved in cell wall bisynthesis n=1 Tax=Desulfacinum infernum DSM 9756 TaxID=1121391 RepID=A0A1M5CST8_9BACT|nr:Glycosyltransferase involved in cell wall bisynthesis [Desulfacinum infernum DSM 9756]